jgi:hypothetical protein
MRISAFVTVLLAFAAQAAFAQSFNSFQGAQFSGLTVSPGVVGGTDYTVSLATGATMLYLGNTYHINNVFGFYVLGAGNSLSTDPGTTQNGWDANTATVGGGVIGGWEGNPADSRPPGNGLLPGATPLSFSFASLAGADASDTFGFHLRVDEQLPNGGNTGFFTPVPEPTPLALFAIGGIGLLARRRRKSA